MNKKNKISFDKTEICVMDDSGKRSEVLNLVYDRIPNITIENCKTRKLFKSIPDQRIVIAVSGREKPVVFYKSKELHYDEYATGLEKFAKANRVTFYNKLV